MTSTVNGKLLVEPYKTDGAIKSSVKSGFATVKQKSTLVGLKAITNGAVYKKNGDVLEFVEKGDLVYFKEEDLHTQAWSKTVFTCDHIKGEFVIAEVSQVVMVGKSGS